MEKLGTIAPAPSLGGQGSKVHVGRQDCSSRKGPARHEGAYELDQGKADVCELQRDVHADCIL